MPLKPGDLMFVGYDADNDDAAFITTVNLDAGEVIYFTDDEWNGTEFNDGEQLIEWTVPAGGIPMGTYVTIDMERGPASASFDVGGSVDYIRGGGSLAPRNEMFWAFQGTRVGDDVTPTNFIAVIANEADGSQNQTPQLLGTGLTTDNGAIIIDGDEDYMEFDGDGDLPDPSTRQDVIDAVSDLSQWVTADGSGNSNPNGTGFTFAFPTVVCFAAGTQIATPFGPRPVEDLKAGDVVLTADRGPQTIRWTDMCHMSPEDLDLAPELAPVRIEANAFGPGLPSKPLRVSPQHRIHVASSQTAVLYGHREMLAPAIGLVNASTIYQESADHAVTYHHLMLDRHEILISNGLKSESFLPGDQAISALKDRARAGLFASFQGRSANLHQAPARPILTRREALVL